MPKLPVVAIIGRPNTGKSTLFNRIVGERKAIVSDIPGTTRDHVSKKVEGETVDYLLIDTGGMGASRDKDFEKDVYEQSILALEHADLILFTVNAKEDLTSDDHRIATLLRKHRKRHVPIIVLLTKCDNTKIESNAIGHFSEIGVGITSIAMSAPHNSGIKELYARIEKELKKMHFDKKVQEKESESKAPRVAIVGKPNVGKSSLVNALMSEPQRKRSPMLVSPIAGTTRDSIDMEIIHDGKPYMLVDTAGLKKHARTNEEIERYASVRSITAIENCDVVVMVVDASEELSQQDKRIARMVYDAGKGLIVLLNKMDLLEGDARKQKIHDVGILLSFCKFAAIVPASAKTREGILKLYDMIDAVALAMHRRVPTPELRRWFEKCAHGHPLGEVGKAKYITQAKDLPPTFVIFVRNPKRVSVSQLRYLDNRLRETFGFEGVPTRWITKGAERE